MSTQKQRRDRTRSLIHAALKNSPYNLYNMDKSDAQLHYVYCVGLLTELLAYSASDLMEVNARLEYLAARDVSELPKLKTNKPFGAKD